MPCRDATTSCRRVVAEAAGARVVLRAAPIDSATTKTVLMSFISCLSGGCTGDGNWCAEPNGEGGGVTSFQSPYVVRRFGSSASPGCDDGSRWTSIVRARRKLAPFMCGWRVKRVAPRCPDLFFRYSPGEPWARPARPTFHPWIRPLTNCSGCSAYTAARTFLRRSSTRPARP